MLATQKLPLFLSCLTALVSSTASAETTLIDDDAASVLYLGDWSSETDVLARQGTLHSSSSPGARMTVEFSGDFARVLGATGPDRGKAKVRLCSQDGTSCESAELDEYSKVPQHDQVVFARYGLPTGRYRIELELPDAASGSVSVDGIAFGSAVRGSRYVDSRLANCSNINSGEASNAPWCDFSNLNGETFAAGAQVLLARGAVWNQQLGKLYGEGNPDSWIAVDAYGQGAAPSIRRSGAATDRAIWLDNPSYWSVSNLEVSNAGAGIVAYFTTNGHVGLRLTHLYTHDNDKVHYRSADDWVPALDLPGMYHGAAIFITGNVPVTDDIAAISDVEVSDIESARDSDPLDIAGFNPSPGRLNFLSTTLGHHAVRNVRVHNVNFHDAKGAPNFDNVEEFRLFSSRLTRMCTEHQDIGTTSLFFWSAADVTITNNVISDLPYTNSPDGTGTDLESVSSRVRFRSNWFLNNVGAGIEILAARGDTDFQRDHEISGNIFYQNGQTGGALTVDDSDIGNGVDQVSYVGTWADDNETHRHAGGGSAGSYTVRFYGSQIALYGTRGPDYGAAAVVLCRDADNTCREELTFDAFNTTRTPRSLLWQSPHVPRDVYRLTVRTTAVRNPLSSGSALDLDSATIWNPSYFMGAPQESSIFLLNLTGKPDAVTGRAQGNIYFEPGGFTSSEPLGNYRWGLSGNLRVAARSLFDARVQASGAMTYPTTLRQELFDGSTFRALLGTADGERWEANNAFVSAFDLQPPPCAACSVARAWTAPHAGTIAVRGWAMKHALGGDGVLLRITKNGSQVWPRASGWQALDGSDREGLPTYVDELAVATGDTLRFEVAAGSSNDSNADLVSWSPTVAFTKTEQNGLLVVQNDHIGSDVNRVAYSAGQWSERNGTHEASAADASLSIAFEGTQVTVHGPRGPEQGAAALTLCTSDSERCLDETTVELFDSTGRPDQVIWTSPLVPLGRYRLRLRAVPGTHGPGNRVAFDYAALSSNTHFINDDDVGTAPNQVEYRGAGWSQTGNIHYHEGTATDAFYLVRFSGAQATVSGGKNVDRGIAAFSVCDLAGQGCGPETLVDAYASTLQIKQMLWTSPVQEQGEHTIKVRPTQTRNSASTGTIIDFDRAIID